MKNIKVKIALFAIPILLFWIITEYFYRTIPNNYSVKNQYIKNHSKDIEVLLFGDSHCLYGLNPDYFSKNTFNLSNVSQTIYFDKLLLFKHIDNLPNLKQVVFCIEYTNLSQRDNTDEDRFRKYYYQYFMDLKVPIIKDYDIKQYSLALTQNFKKTIDLYIRYLKTGTILDCNLNGWGNNYKQQNRISPEKVAKNRAQSQEDGLTDFKLNTARIDTIIAECEKRKIQVLIVSMPQTKIYTRYLNPKKLKSIFKTCNQFQKSSKNTVHYLNLFNDNRFNDEDFYDADHLNNQGAKKCSKIVNAYLNSISSN